MYIDIVPNRSSRPAVLLRERFREDGRVLERTVANLSHLPHNIVGYLRVVFKGGIAVPSLEDAFSIERSRPHGHVAAIAGGVRRCRLEKLLSPRPCRERDLVVAMIMARIINPRSKLATARSFADQTLANSWAEELGVEDATSDELYSAMDWLLEQPTTIEQRLAKRLLCATLLDEVGYVPFAQLGAELSFQIIGERAEKATIIITTNVPFSEWTHVFPNERLCKALLDRITDRAHSIDTGTESYRFKRTLARQKSKATRPKK